jgi:hypothetical protein
MISNWQGSYGVNGLLSLSARIAALLLVVVDLLDLSVSDCFHLESPSLSPDKATHLGMRSLQRLSLC